MVPVIALVGRPNVGKSTLFNRLTGTRNALVADLPGLTRDRQYGKGFYQQQQPFILIDTGGLSGEEIGVDGLMARQSLLAIDEADWVFFLTDARAGLTPDDEAIARQLRLRGKKLFLLVNKVDGLDPEVVVADFYALGLGEPYSIAASQGRGIRSLLEQVFEPWLEQQRQLAADAQTEVDATPANPDSIKLAIIGRPNVGKSTLVNRMLGEERVVVYDMPGTTRDSIYIPMERNGEAFTLIDTAGVRRRGRVHEVIEKFSVIKTLQAVEDAHVVLVVIDARESLTDQDLSLLGFALDEGRALVIAVNKWDGMDAEAREQVRKDLGRRLDFVDFARIHMISALHGTGVGDLWGSVREAFKSAMGRISTPDLNRALEKAVEQNPPPLHQGRRIKLRYGHLGGVNPPQIVLHGNHVSALPAAYQRYLANFFRRVFKLVGTPVRIELRDSTSNPYAGKTTELTTRQIDKKRRRIEYFKK